MLSAKSRALLDRYTLASHALSQEFGERLMREAGQSVEFYDFRPYQAGDELRYVDWKVYGRTGRLYTRLHQAERSIRVYILLDTSLSMSIGGKGEYAKTLAQLLTYSARQSIGAYVYLFDGSNQSAKKVADIPKAWSFIQNAPQLTQSSAKAIKNFALANKHGLGLVLIISDLFDETPLQKSLVALKARGFDVSFLHVMSKADLEPKIGQFEVIDIESKEKVIVGPKEIIAYRRTVQAFLKGVRQNILKAGFKYVLFKADKSNISLEHIAITSLVQKRILIKR